MQLMKYGTDKELLNTNNFPENMTLEELKEVYNLQAQSMPLADFDEAFQVKYISLESVFCEAGVNEETGEVNDETVKPCLLIYTRCGKCLKTWSIPCMKALNKLTAMVDLCHENAPYIKSELVKSKRNKAHSVRTIVIV